MLRWSFDALQCQRKKEKKTERETVERKRWALNNEKKSLEI